MFKGKVKVIGTGIAPGGLPVAGGAPTEEAFTLNLQPIVGEGSDFANATSFLLPVKSLDGFEVGKTITLTLSK